MTDQVGECIYETREGATRGLRIFYWAVGIIVPVTISVLAIGNQDGLAIVVFGFAGMWVVHLLNGFCTVSGVRVYTNRLCITTPLDYREFDWSRVTIKWYASTFIRTDVSVHGVVWPYMIAFGLPGWRSAVKAIRNVKAQSR